MPQSRRRPDEDGGPTLFLVLFHAADPVEPIADECVRLGDGLWLVRTRETRSRLYHGVKRMLPTDTPLLVAPLADAPKFKGMAPGALAWLRSLGRDFYPGD